MVEFNPPLPPPSDSAIAAALVLLQIASDPAGTKKRLNEIVGQLAAIQAESRKVEAARAAAEASERRLADDLGKREQTVASLQTQTAVAAAAVAKREEGLDSRERAISARESAIGPREADVAGKEQALADRLALYRQALA